MGYGNGIKCYGGGKTFYLGFLKEPSCYKWHWKAVNRCVCFKIKYLCTCSQSHS